MSPPPMKTKQPKLTAAEFCQIGHSLYGDHWRSKLADILSRDVRTVRRWGTGESPVPAAVVRKLKRLKARRDKKPGPAQPNDAHQSAS